MSDSHIQKPLKGMKTLGMKWAGTDPETVDDDTDMVSGNGTDAKSGKIVKGMGGLPPRMPPPEEGEGGYPEEDEGGYPEEDEGGYPEEGEDEHPDEDQDRALIEEMMAKKSGKGGGDPLLEKSFSSFAMENPVIKYGAENAPMLCNMLKSLDLAFGKFNQNTGALLKSVQSDHSDLAKSMDETFLAIGSSIGLIDETQARMALQKSQSTSAKRVSVAERIGEGQEFSRREILQRLEKSVEAGEVAPFELIKFETSGQLSPSLRKSLNI